MDPKASDPSNPSPTGPPAPPGPTDGQLVTQALSGTPNGKKAFDELIRRYQRQAVAVSYRLLGNTHDALEVTQDAFLKAFTSLATLAEARGVRRMVDADRFEPVAELSPQPKDANAQLPLDDVLGPAGGEQTEAAGGQRMDGQHGDPVHAWKATRWARSFKEALARASRRNSGWRS